MGLSRRRFLSDVGMLTLGVALGTFGRRSEAGAEVPKLPWPYEKLDPDAVARRAYEGYYEGRCSYGAFEAIVGELRDEVGYPYTLIPTGMMAYGRGGVAGWGDLCGALNGACAAVNLVVEDFTSIIDELMAWYVREAILTYRPPNPRVEVEVTSVSGSTLCHVSVARWCKASGFEVDSPQRQERCARLTGQVAAEAVRLLNDYHEGRFGSGSVLPASASECGRCHIEGGAVGNVKGKMDCFLCHRRHEM